MEPLDVVIPVYNESLDEVRRTIETVKTAFSGREGVRVIVVNDGSDSRFGLDVLCAAPGIVYVEHEFNHGYGAALKAGILAGEAPWIAIVDADGTYPVESLPALVAAMADADMVVGTRTGPVREIPLLRRLPKRLLNVTASYMAGMPIRDLNSGMRVFSRRLCYQLWGLLPRRFSFTATMTMGALLSGYRVKEIAIDYRRRVGASSIRPLRDTIQFFHTILRLGLLFKPMRLFFPVSMVLFLVGAGKGFLYDFLKAGRIGTLAGMLMLAALQIILMGYLGEMIVTSRMLSDRDVGRDRRRSDREAGP